MKYIDLFSGAGGLSEGFMQEGFEPIAHVETDTHACKTLGTRLIFHFLKNEGRLDIYNDYLLTKISRDKLLQNCLSSQQKKVF